MDSRPTDEHRLAGSGGESEDSVPKYPQSTHFFGGESNDIEKRSTPAGNTANAQVSSILTSILSSTITHQHTTTQQTPERIPFNKKWELLKPKIERLYIYENVPLRDIVGIMKEVYDFDAV